MGPGAGPAAPISTSLHIEIVPCMTTLWIQSPLQYLLPYCMKKDLTRFFPSLFLRLVSKTVLKTLLCLRSMVSTIPYLQKVCCLL